LALKPEGKLWIVANKHLPYEKLMKEGFAETSVVLQQDGYKILMGSHPNPIQEMPERKKR
jgi:16S rRNA (guanine1207-N2)-methyltransferase